MRVTPLARRLGSTALVLMLGVGLSACNEESKSAGATDSTDSSSTPDAESDVDPEVDSFDEPAGTALEESSAADFYPAVMMAMREAETFAFSTTSSGEEPDSTMKGQVRFGDDGLEMKAASTGVPAMEMIIVDKAMYMKAPDMGTGDKYLKVDLSDPNSLFGVLGKAIDPEVMFKSMEAPKKFEFLGTEEIDGVDTNHYRITIDPAEYLKAMQFPEQMASFMPDDIQNEMWVDADNLPRKFSQTTETSPPGGGEPVVATSEGFYTDFGIDVDIQAPPADQVSDKRLPGSG